MADESVTTEVGLPTRVQVVATLAANRAALAARYPICELGVFGSYLRGEQRRDSDIAILVAFDVVPSLFTLVALEDALGSMLGLPVDLAVKSTLRPQIGARILHEVVAV